MATKANAHRHVLLPAYGLNVRFVLPVAMLRQLVAGWLQRGECRKQGGSVGRAMPGRERV